MSDYSPALPHDLPPDILSLSRHVARVCTQPGVYTITLTIPHYPHEPKTAVITRLETIRVISMNGR